MLRNAPLCTQRWSQCPFTESGMCVQCVSEVKLHHLKRHQKSFCSDASWYWSIYGFSLGWDDLCNYLHSQKFHFSFYWWSLYSHTMAHLCVKVTFNSHDLEVSNQMYSTSMSELTQKHHKRWVRSSFIFISVSLNMHELLKRNSWPSTSEPTLVVLLHSPPPLQSLV